MHGTLNGFSVTFQCVRLLFVQTGPHDFFIPTFSGTVKGDIVARERVELGAASKIYGNIWTRSIVIKNGAIFEGVCKMIEEAQMAS